MLLKEDAQYDAAMAHFERALGVRPGDPGVRYQIVTIYVSRGETDRALPELEPIVKEAPTFLEAHVTLATVYYRLKRREDGDRERAIVDALNKEIQAKQPGAVGAEHAGDTTGARRHDSPRQHTTVLVLRHIAGCRGSADAGAGATGRARRARPCSVPARRRCCSTSSCATSTGARCATCARTRSRCSRTARRAS